MRLQTASPPTEFKPIANVLDLSQGIREGLRVLITVEARPQPGDLSENVGPVAGAPAELFDHWPWISRVPVT
ncbi:hypothetical protein ACFC1I_16030 [Microbacterium sp. NPDC056044]|uniref:hypothetical protein n=1 Tax=Microbacterium sp. NPDC056044 TaxID=3345690 RepID=UPI0035D569FD